MREEENWEALGIKMSEFVVEKQLLFENYKERDGPI